MFWRDTGMKEDEEEVDAREGAWSIETAMFEIRRDRRVRSEQAKGALYLASMAVPLYGPQGVCDSGRTFRYAVFVWCCTKTGAWSGMAGEGFWQPEGGLRAEGSSLAAYLVRAVGREQRGS